MRAIGLLADQVHAELVAEGVDNLDDLKALRTLGIRFAQGFLFSRPRPADEVSDLMRKQEAPPAPRAVETWSGRPSFARVAQAS